MQPLSLIMYNMRLLWYSKQKLLVGQKVTVSLGEKLPVMFCCGFQKHKEHKANVGTWHLKSTHTAKQTLIYKKGKINKIQVKLMPKEKHCVCDLRSNDWKHKQTEPHPVCQCTNTYIYTHGHDLMYWSELSFTGIWSHQTSLKQLFSRWVVRHHTAWFINLWLTSTY